MDNPFFNVRVPDGIIPRRAYALIDRRVDSLVLMDAIDADWADKHLPGCTGMRGFKDIAADAPIFVLEIPVRIFKRWWPAPLPRYQDPTRLCWIEIVLAGGNDGQVYSNLFGSSRSVAILEMRTAPLGISSSLDRAFSLHDHLVDAVAIVEALRPLDTEIAWVGVYDVGQGSANGLCNAHGLPCGYFDLGGGVFADRDTFPAALYQFCASAEPPVMLSHWDWDHWSSGARFGGMETLTWIAPYQKLGPVHATFAAGLPRLLIWPASLSQVKVRQVTILKCVGRDRNNSGLAVKVAGPLGEPPILLPGDARYSAIPDGMGDFTSLVVPHHGENMHCEKVPIGRGLQTSRTAYSYGDRDIDSHPHPATYARHNSAHWPQTSVHMIGGLDLHTKDRILGGLGHIGLNWSGTASLPVLPCGGRKCAMGLVQR